MRRILLGGFALGLGALAPAALAQQPAPAPPQPARAAKLGRPVALPSPAPGPSAPARPAAAGDGVTQAGLFRNSAPPPATSYAPPAAFGTPTLAQPPGGSPLPAPTPVPTPMPMPMGAPMPMVPPAQPGGAAPPTVTETRDPTGRIPSGAVLVPSVAPNGYDCPAVCPDDPLCPPQAGGLNRLGSCGRNWVTAEYLMWWSRSAQVPALVTTSSPAFNGVPGAGDTRVLLGGAALNDTFHSGLRIGGGHWFDDGCRGFDWRMFWIAPSSANFSAGVPPYSILARPFVNVNPTVTTPGVGVGPTAEVVAGPGVATGRVTAQLTSTLWGAEANYRRFLASSCFGRLDALVGYRYLDLSERLTVSESFVRVPGSAMTVGTPAVAGVITDRFHTENQFHGGQIGLAGTVQRGRWSLNTRATIAFGTVFQSADIAGAQRLTFPNGGVLTTPGGLLAVPGANIGHWSQSRFAVVPEVGVNLGYQVTQNMQLFVGYNFLALSSAVRPGGAINQNIDAARVPNLLPPGSATPISPPQPYPQLHTTAYYIQGINFGLMYRW
jgi:hypothetical protein